MKNLLFNSYDGFTYLKGRKCKNCEKPIADQEHASRTHCPKVYTEFGNVIDCKTMRHKIENKPDNDLHKSVINRLKEINCRIEMLLAKKGNEVHTDDLTAYDITLTNAVNFEIKPDFTLISYFLKHRIVSNPISNKHKIEEYEQ
jgi:hypothetical protein